MWFAALGSYQNNPWFVHLIDKLLDQCAPVANLLDEPDLVNDKEEFSIIRARLYHYDFTRWDTEWNRDIPGTFLLPQDIDESTTTSGGSDGSPWWSRTLVREYLPPIEKNNSSVRSFLDRNGYSKSCLNKMDQCQLLFDNNFVKAGRLCTFTAIARQYHSVWWLPILVILVVQCLL